MDDRVVAACDGASKGNPGSAGWGWVLVAGDGASGRWESGAMGTATNNAAELTALERLLEAVDSQAVLEVRMDSEYARKCVTVWLPGWRQKGWRNSKGQPVANRELIERIADLLEGRTVTLVHVAAHQVGGDKLNAFADAAADEAARSQKSGRGSLSAEQARVMLEAAQQAGGTKGTSGRGGTGSGGAGASAGAGTTGSAKASSSRIIEARYSGACPCGERYAAGTPIAKGPRGWGHPQCAGA